MVALIGGAFWLVDQNTRNKLAAETDAVAGRSATTSNLTDLAESDGGDQKSQQNAAIRATCRVS